jgi:phage tail-like protein
VSNPGTPNPVTGSYHVQVDIPGVTDAGALLFYSATTPDPSLDGPDFATWDAQGNPINSIGGGRQVTWSPVTISRGIDSNMTLWTWFTQVRDQGATSQTKKSVNLTWLDHAGTAMFTWNLTGAIIVGYSQSGGNAQSSEILVNTVQIKYEDATLNAGGGAGGGGGGTP